MGYLRKHANTVFYLTLTLLSFFAVAANYHVYYITQNYIVFSVTDFDEEGNLLVNIYDR